jgi:hypothetical protein
MLSDSQFKERQNLLAEHIWQEKDMTGRKHYLGTVYGDSKSRSGRL